MTHGEPLFVNDFAIISSFLCHSSSLAMAAKEVFKFKTEPYKLQVQQHWPQRGRHILAQYDEERIIVYQAFCPEIADYAVANQR